MIPCCIFPSHLISSHVLAPGATWETPRAGHVGSFLPFTFSCSPVLTRHVNRTLLEHTQGMARSQQVIPTASCECGCSICFYSLCFETNSVMMALNAWGEFQAAHWEEWWCISSKWTLVSGSKTLHCSEGFRKAEGFFFFLLRYKAIINSELSILDKGRMCVMMFIFCYLWQETWIKVKAHSLISCIITRVKQTPDCLLKVWEMLICSSVCLLEGNADKVSSNNSEDAGKGVLVRWCLFAASALLWL